jgi:hypothetical protein
MDQELLKTYQQSRFLLHLQYCRKARFLFDSVSVNRKRRAEDPMPAFVPSRITGVTRPDFN